MSFLRSLAEDEHDSHSDSLAAFFYNETTGEALVDSSHDDNKDRESPWGAIIGASFVVQAVTLSGLVFLAGITLYRQMVSGKTNQDCRSLELSRRWTHSIIPSFAAGTLIATVVFLLIPEALALLGSSSSEDEGDDDHSGHNHRVLQHDDHGSSWKFGTAFLAGFFFPILIGMFFPHHSLDDVTAVPTEEPKVSNTEATVNDKPEYNEMMVDGNLEEATKATDTVEEPISINTTVKSTETGGIRHVQLATSILAGDAMHNFCDGVFLGTAFLLCDHALGWTVVAATIYHEIAQEVADFTILVSICNFSIVGALVSNFLVGFSVILGAALVAWVDMSNATVGIILSISAGVYIHISAAECIPRVQTDKGLAAFFFVLGAVPIGLVLLNHPHCSEH